MYLSAILDLYYNTWPQNIIFISTMESKWYPILGDLLSCLAVASDTKENEIRIFLDSGISHGPVTGFNSLHSKISIQIQWSVVSVLLLMFKFVWEGCDVRIKDK